MIKNTSFDNKAPILEVKNLKKYFETPSGMLHAVDDVSFELYPGKTLGVVGESGCGKSTMGRAILRLHEPTSGEVIFEGQDVLALSPGEMKKKRRDMQIIFQDPFASLNPRMTIYETIAEPFLIQKVYRKNEVEKIKVEVLNLMKLVGLAERLINSYPHELDGGRRQRIGIARALALKPKLIICDEPVSALDVSIQAQILNLLQDIQDKLGLTLIFITHDLSVVKHLSDEIAVMYLGMMVEKCKAEDLFKNPLHPYTKALLSAIPIPNPDLPGNQITLKGELTSPIEPEPGCRFAKRCLYATPGCTGRDFELKEVGKDHFVACILYDNTKNQQEA
ncbi:oligopeptide/dipeptide ABC transporter ATP-binding protein [Proteiniclasticum sp. QWL-01]|uniref:ABC transporter ATP-binding protein n=1 Tax=Proteiniclasticum sp. QWL-01 TaxID=3036945 RepID=UPI0024110743|nr:oligopeptide/dipeptide ABC transporter ATP-binding protein [Proteiniclasticum sp. QWL-01]WFF73467.1 ATP-binding cassette domain-containing protein [Proteiniclasticum sp. QWL-01]